MCGLVGEFRVAGDVHEHVVRSMLESIRHRGPDDTGFFFDGGIGLGHARLSIIDIAHGHQPMTSVQSTMVYNGELYNFQLLRDELCKKGISFKTASDSEVLLEYLRAYGADQLERLNGMFAFALWDAQRQELVLARDRFGIKPMYYVQTPGGVVFGSEIKALLRHPNVDAVLNRGAIGEFLTFRSVIGPQTLFEGVRELPPGHVLRYRRGDCGPKISAFWQDGAGAGANSGGGVDELDTMLDRSVHSQLVSDVPLGTFLSGGVDSSLTTYYAVRHSSEQRHSFSVGFPNADVDESAYAGLVAEDLGTIHHAVAFDGERFGNALTRSIWHNDVPLQHPNAVCLLALSEVAKQTVSVVLTGEGADETLGGYPRLQIPLMAHAAEVMPLAVRVAAQSLMRRLPARRINKLAANFSSARDSVVFNQSFVPTKTVAEIVVQRDAIDYSRRFELADACMASGQNFLDAVLCYERATYLPHLLHRVDRATMAAGLEARVPFLDNDYCAFAASLPNDMKIRVGKDNKVILKTLARRLLPAEIVDRRKEGFGIPLDDWLNDATALKPFVDELKLGPVLGSGLLYEKRVKNMLAEHETGARFHGELIWNLINLDQWVKTFEVTV